MNAQWILHNKARKYIGYRMTQLREETVCSVHHWNESLFSFTTTRSPAFRFGSGHFVMLGIAHEGKSLLRAYSLASASHEDRLEFLSIKVPNGPLTSRLQHLKPGDTVLVSNKPTGTLLLSDLRPGKVLYLFGTGTGLAPFMSIIQEPEAYERFEMIVLVHGVRHVSELAYRDYITKGLPHHEYLGGEIRDKLAYYPTVTREPFVTRGRITELIQSGKMFSDLNLPPLTPATDRAMVCGGPDMLADLCKLLDERGFEASPARGSPGDYVIEKAFAQK
jgi:ferredoxin--NADP+ reductase